VPFDFSPYDAVLLDLDGTLYHEEHVLPGAAELVRRIQRENRKYACLTNSTSSPQRLQARLARMGIEMPADCIYTAAAAAADYVLERFRPRAPITQDSALGAQDSTRPRVFNLATEGLHDLLDARVTWINAKDDQCDAVIAGAPANVFATPDRQCTALYLLRAGATLVGICADRVYPSPRGLELGSGALTQMMAYAADTAPVFAGKPEAIFFEELCRRLQVRPQRCILIGDNLESDIAGARHFGMATVLTLTGVTRPQDVPAIPPHLRPDGIVEDLTKLA
jgi:HAD superfamily hydrolase (TIGR01450 family)